MEHTPGPWIVTELNPAPEPGFAYAVGHDPLGPSEVPWPIALAVTPNDARLIAAAPALLEALDKAMEDAWYNDDSNIERLEPEWLVQARAAIQAATTPSQEVTRRPPPFMQTSTEVIDGQDQA